MLNDPHDYYIEKTCDYRLLGNAERTNRDELNSNIQISQSASKLAIHAKIKGQQRLCNGGGTSGPHLDDRRDDESDNCTHTRQRAARCMLPPLACRHSTQKPPPDMFLHSTPVSGWKDLCFLRLTKVSLCCYQLFLERNKNTTVKENHSQTDVILFSQDFFSFSISVTRTVCIHVCLFVSCVGVYSLKGERRNTMTRACRSAKALSQIASLRKLFFHRKCWNVVKRVG